MSKTTNLSALADNARIVGNSVFLEGNSGVFFDDGSSYARGIYSSGTDVRIQTNAMNRLQVDSEGRVTMPYQPAFFAYLTGGWTHPSGIIKVGGTFTAKFNKGNHYNTSNSRFTAPVSGAYQFNVSTATNGGISNINYISAEVWVNGSSANAYRGGWDSGGSSYNRAASSYTIYMNAGDYAELYMELNISAAMPLGNTYITFSGCLLG